jgi:hypothetical protein
MRGSGRAHLLSIARTVARSIPEFQEFASERESRQSARLLSSAAPQGTYGQLWDLDINAVLFNVSILLHADLPGESLLHCCTLR